MKEPLVMIFDVGTQSIRAILVDKEGNVIAKTKKDEVLYMSNDNTNAEKNTYEYWNCLAEVSQELKKEYPDLFDRIEAVSVTCIRNSLVFLDKDNKPTRDAIIWLDKREVECKKPYPLLYRIAFKLVGMAEVARVMRKNSYTNWVKEMQPEVWEKTAKLCVPSAYFNYRLTGRLADSNAAQACKIPYDYKKKKWLGNLAPNVQIFGCNKDRMCELVEPGDIVGYITENASKETGLKVGTKVIATGADKACETLGVGSNTERIASISYGTAASVELTLDKYVEPENFMPAYSAVLKDKYNPDIQLFRGYWMVSWFKEQFCEKEVIEAKNRGIKVEQVLDEMMLKVPIGCNGLILQPFWGPGLTTPDARGAIIGFNDSHTKMHLYRAIIEGIGFGLLDGLTEMEKRAKVKVEKIGLSGGGSTSDIVCQLTADMFGREVYRVQTHETSSLGSALICYTTLGIYKDVDEAIENMVHIKDTFKPNMENNAKYQEIYKKVYKKMFKRLRPMYKAMYTTPYLKS